MTKKAIIFLVILLIIIGLVVTFHTLKGSEDMNNVSYHELAITNMTLTEESFTAHCFIIVSSKTFRNYTYVIEDDSLYITVSGGLVSKKYPHGGFDIIINDTALKNVDVVFLKSHKETSQIYSR